MPQTPKMNLDLPTPAVSEGPEWANSVNEAFEVIDSHDHSSGSGQQVTPAGISINAPLEFNSQNVTELGKAQYTAQQSVLTGAGHIRSTWFGPDGEAYITDGAGNAVQLTLGGFVTSATASGNITGVAGTQAEIRYTNATSQFALLSNGGTNTAAHLDVAQVKLRTTTPGDSVYLTLARSPSQAGNYTLTLPQALPGATSVVQLGAAGQLTASNALGVLTASSLSTTGDVAVGGNLTVVGTSVSTIAADSLTVTGFVTVGTTLSVTGASTLAGVTAGAISATTLNSSGATTVGTNLSVAGTSSLTGALTVAGLITANGGVTTGAGDAVSVGGNLSVTGTSTFTGTVTAGTLNVTTFGATTLSSSGATTVGTNLTVNGTSTLTGAVTVAGLLTANGGVTTGAGDPVTVGGALSVTGTSALTGAVTVAGLLTANGGVTTGAGDNVTVGGNLSVTGTSSLTGATSVSSIATSSFATVGGALNVTGAATLSSTLAVAGLITANGGLNTGAGDDVNVGGDLTVTGDATFNSLITANGGFTIPSRNLIVPASAGSIADPARGVYASNGVLLATGSAAEAHFPVILNQGDTIESITVKFESNSAGTKTLALRRFSTATNTLADSTGWNQTFTTNTAGAHNGSVTINGPDIVSDGGHYVVVFEMAAIGDATSGVIITYRRD